MIIQLFHAVYHKLSSKKRIEEYFSNSFTGNIGVI